MTISNGASPAPSTCVLDCRKNVAIALSHRCSWCVCVCVCVCSCVCLCVCASVLCAQRGGARRRNSRDRRRAAIVQCRAERRQLRTFVRSSFRCFACYVVAVIFRISRCLIALACICLRFRTFGLRQLSTALEMILSGSYRRGAESCGDVDVIFAPKVFSLSLCSICADLLRRQTTRRAYFVFSPCSDL